MSKYAIGVDYGTLSVRALLVNIETGEEAATSVYEYPHGVMEEHLPTGERLPSGWALQEPQDYVEGLILTIRNVLTEKKVLPEEVIGIGVDFTSSTVIPVKSDRTPLCHLEKFARNPHAYVKLWKHHGAEEEALQIDRIAKERGEKWLPLYGGKVSSEWMIPKILETLHHAPDVYKEADRFMEALDWIIWQMTGEETRSACGAGYKAFYRHDSGYPTKDFFKALDPAMENIVEEKLDAPIKSIGNSTTTPRDLECDQDVQIILMALTESVAARLRKHGFKCNEVSISIRDNDLYHFSRQKKIQEPTDITDEIMKAAYQLFKENYHWSRPIRSLGIRADDLVMGTVPVQLDLFMNEQRREKQEKLDRAVDEIRRRFGYHSVQRAFMYQDKVLSSLDAQKSHTVHPVGYFNGR